LDAYLLLHLGQFGIWTSQKHLHKSSGKDSLNIWQIIFYSASFQIYHLGQHTMVTNFPNLTHFETLEVTKYRQIEWIGWCILKSCLSIWLVDMKKNTNDPNQDSTNVSLESNLKISKYEEGLSISLQDSLNSSLIIPFHYTHRDETRGGG
jgi:hypothetical protein